MTGPQHTILALFIIIIFLRVYQAGKIQSFWSALNGAKVATATPTTAQSTTTPPPSNKAS